MLPDPERTERARALRREMTPAEVILWRELRGRRFAGFKFRRQRPVGPFYADFYCHSCRLVVELDGESHLERAKEDARRDAYFRQAGIEVVRFWNNWVYDDHALVMDAIWDALERRVTELDGRPR